MTNESTNNRIKTVTTVTEYFDKPQDGIAGLKSIIEIVDKTKDAEIRAAEKQQIIAMYLSATSQAGTFLELAKQYIFRTDEILAIGYVEQENAHGIEILFKNSTRQIVSFKFGSVEKALA